MVRSGLRTEGSWRAVSTQPSRAGWQREVIRPLDWFRDSCTFGAQALEVQPLRWYGHCLTDLNDEALGLPVGRHPLGCGRGV